MLNAKYISYKGNTNFIRVYQGAELVWEKYVVYMNKKTIRKR